MVKWILFRKIIAIGEKDLGINLAYFKTEGQVEENSGGQWMESCRREIS